MSELDSAFDFLQRCISVDKDSVWIASKSDPIAALLASLESDERAIEECDASSHCLSQGIASRASSSSTPNDQAQFFDVRIQYGHKIISALLKVSQELANLKNDSDSMSTLVSLRRLSVLSTSFQFFILACISPYLEKGVGVPLQLRSQIIKSWEQCAGDLEFRKSQLTNAAQCIVSLLGCNDAVRAEILRKYCSDIICTFEQLRFFECADFNAAQDDILSAVPPQLLVITLLGLVKQRTGADPIPQWFSLAVGSRLSAILVGNNGLEVNLLSFEEINGDQFWQNTHLLSVFGRQLTLPPRNTKRMLYYENITNQFLLLIRNEKFPLEGLAQLFASFADVVREKDALAFSLFIEDPLFKPWEVLPNAPNPSWSLSHSISLCLLKLWSCDRIGAQLLRNNSRYMAAVSTLLCLIPIASCDAAHGLRNLEDDFHDVLKFALEKVENLSDFILAFVTDVSSSSFHVSQEKRLVEVVHEKSTIYGKVTLSRLRLNTDELLAKKIEAALTLIKSFEGTVASRLLIEVSCKSVKMWENQDLPRFMEHGCPRGDSIEFRRMSSHFIAGAFFEQLQDMSVSFADSDITVSLLDLIQTILDTTIRYLNDRSIRASLDVVGVLSEQDLQLHSAISQNVKIAIGLAGAVIMTATVSEKVSSALSAACSALASFSDNVQELGCEDDAIFAMAQDARQLSSIFSNESPVLQSASSVSSKDVERRRDIVASIRERLTEGSPVERGGALIDAARLIRFKNTNILLELDRWLFEAMKNAISDSDSYVYLAAINALAEAACYGSTYLRELIALFKNFRISTLDQENYNSHGDAVEKNNADREVIVRSRLCEVLGKVFCVLGDMSPVWMDESVGIFLKCITESDEIIRASALTSLSELILACHGRRIEKYLEEVFYAIERVLSGDSSALVRRAGVNLIRNIVKSCDTAVVDVIGRRLRDLHRQLLHLWRWDSDHVVRLHAELALEELRSIMKTMIAQETTCPGRIKL